MSAPTKKGPIPVDPFKKPAPATVARAEEVSLDVNVGFKSTNPDHRVEVEWVDPADLFADPDIQRGVELGEVDKIVNHFNEMALGTITVAVRETPTGRVLSLLDGLQRTTAMQRVGYDKPVRALVHYGLSRSEEAQLFLDLNFRRSVSAIRQFRARLTAEDPAALAIMAILVDTGIPFGGLKGFNAVTTALKIYGQANGPDRLKWALKMVYDIYSDGGSIGCYNGHVIEGFALVHASFSQYIDEQRLVEKLTEIGGGVHKLIGQGRTFQTVNGGKLQNAIGQAIISYYNKHKRRNPAFPTRLPDLPRHRLATKATVVDASLFTDSADDE